MMSAYRVTLIRRDGVRLSFQSIAGSIGSAITNALSAIEETPRTLIVRKE